MDVARRVEVVVDDVRIGDEKALVAREHVVDGIAGVIARELEEHRSGATSTHPHIVERASSSPSPFR